MLLTTPINLLTHRPDAIEIERAGIPDLRERRGEWAVKQYVHWRGTYQGDDVFIKFRHKHNRTREEVAYHQWCDEIKQYFELNKMSTCVVYNSKEGYGIMQQWWPTYGRLREPPVRPYYAKPENMIELLKISFFDAMIGSLDRHGNNVLCVRGEGCGLNFKLPTTDESVFYQGPGWNAPKSLDRTLLTIDDEDVFYDKQRPIVRFDATIKRGMVLMLARNKNEMDAYRQRVLAQAESILLLADFELMHRGGYYHTLENNLKHSEDLWQIVLSDLGMPDINTEELWSVVLRDLRKQDA